MLCDCSLQQSRFPVLQRLLGRSVVLSQHDDCFGFEIQPGDKDWLNDNVRKPHATDPREKQWIISKVIILTHGARSFAHEMTFHHRVLLLIEHPPSVRDRDEWIVSSVLPYKVCGASVFPAILLESRLFLFRCLYFRRKCRASYCCER